MYWIEGKGNNYTIKVGTLDGSSAKVIVNSGDLKKPTGLFYHIEKHRYVLTFANLQCFNCKLVKD